MDKILESRYERAVMQQLIEDILDNKVMQHDAAIEAIEWLQARVAELERDRDIARAAFDESDIACAELEARVEELQGVVKRLLDATTEATLDRYARVPRGHIRDLEQALQGTEE